MTAAQARQTFEEQKRKHLVDADGHDREIAKAEKRLGEIKTSRERRDHLEKVLARDAGAIKVDEKLAQEESTIERELSTRKRLVADSRRSAETLVATIENAAFLEAIENVASQGEQIKQFSTDSGPHFTAFAELVSRLHRRGVALAESLKALPDPAPRHLSRTIEKLPTIFGEAALFGVGAALRKAGTLVSGPRDLEARSFHGIIDGFFARLAMALATVSATRAGGGPGRKLYRCTQGVGGLSGGLQVEGGEVLALLSDDPETLKLFREGVLEQVTKEAA